MGNWVKGYAIHMWSSKLLQIIASSYTGYYWCVLDRRLMLLAKGRFLIEENQKRGSYSMYFKNIAGLNDGKFYCEINS